MSEDQLRRGIRVFRKSPDFVERIAVAAVVSFSDDGSLFAIDFLKPSLDLAIEGKDASLRLKVNWSNALGYTLLPLPAIDYFEPYHDD